MDDRILKRPFFGLGFKPPIVLVPIMILLFCCFFLLWLGILVFRWGCWMSTCHPWHHFSFLQPLQTGLAFCVGWMLEAIEGFGGCLVGNFGNFFAFTPTSSGKLSCPTLGKGFWKGMSSSSYACNLGDTVSSRVRGTTVGPLTKTMAMFGPWQAGMIYLWQLGSLKMPSSIEWNFVS